MAAFEHGVRLPDDAVTHYEAIETVRHPDAVHLIAYWRECNAKGGLVVGKDIPSRPLARILSFLVIHEPIDNGTDFCTRLAGSMLERRFGRDLAGGRLSEIYPQEIWANRLAWHCRIIETGEPSCERMTITWLERAIAEYEIVGAPVLSPDGSAKWLLVGLFALPDAGIF